MTGWLRRLRRARAGNVALITALMAIPLTGVAGVAVDGARAWLLHSRMTTALDAAALAGARNLSVSVAARDAEVAQMFWSNMGVRGPGFTPAQAIGTGWPSFMDATVRIEEVRAVDERTYEVRARASLPTTFTRVFGRDEVIVVAAAQARRAEHGMELALVLDVTGSMDTNCSLPSNRTSAACGITAVPRAPGVEVVARNNNMDLLRLAAADMVNVLFGSRATAENLWISVVPYTTTVNIGPGRSGWLSAQAQATLAADFAPTAWRGCVEARAGYAGAPANGDRSDATPAEAPFQPFYHRSTLGVYTLAGARVPGDNDWARKLWNATTVGGDAITEDWHVFRGNFQAGPNVGCPQTPILPLSNNKNTILDTIQSLRATSRGGTMGNLGLQAGWFALSPRWRNFWNLGAPPPGHATALPLNYGVQNMNKVVVMMTDGTNQWFDSPYGFPGSCGDGQNTASFPDAGAGFPAPGPAQAVRPVACPPSNQVANVQVAAGGPPISNNADYTGYGRLHERRLGATITNNTQARTEINARMSTLCNNMKAQGIIIYTVVLDTSGSGVDSVTRLLYEGCATSTSHYFLVSQASQLRPAFQQIGARLANLRLVQ